jgi:hypothetical protein
VSKDQSKPGLSWTVVVVVVVLDWLACWLHCSASAHSCLHSPIAKSAYLFAGMSCYVKHHRRL